MATGGEVAGQRPGGAGSDNLHQMKCQPCLDDGTIQEAVGMCIDCDEYLCSKCFVSHTVPRPSRHHKLLNREHMSHGKIRASPKDTCTEHCPVHEDEIIKYYCTIHCMLGCTACVTLNHATCKTVQYIPHVAKDLTSNDAYMQVEKEIKSALDAFKEVFKTAEINSEELNKDCADAVNSIHDFKKQVDDYLRRSETEMAEKARGIKAKAEHELEMLKNKYKTVHEELQSSLAKVEALRNANQNCISFTEMMRTKGRLQSLTDRIKDAELDKEYRHTQIQFSPNLDLLETLKNTKAIGTVTAADPRSFLSGSDEVTVISDTDTCAMLSGSDMVSLSRSVTTAGRDRGTITKAAHGKDLNVRTEIDTCEVCIRGIAVLPDSRLAITDDNNKSIKVVNVQTDQIEVNAKLSSSPRDVAALSDNGIVVCLPVVHKLAFFTVKGNSMCNDRMLEVNGQCQGVDYRYDKLAVSFINPDKVEVLNMYGTVLYTIATDKSGKTLFSGPFYLTFGKDDTTLYVTNYCSSSASVMCVKHDGTVVATYKDGNLKYPQKAVVDSNGNVYACSWGSNTIHQITKDCKKLRVLLTEADGVRYPYSVCLNEEKNELYIGMGSNDNVKVYTLERETPPSKPRHNFQYIDI